MFTASPVQERLYQISPARERYYDIIADHIEENNVGTIDKDELRKEISHVKSEDEEHERNIDNMTQEDDYKSPWKEKDETIVNNTLDDTGFRVLNSFQDYTSDSSKQVETSRA